MKNPRPEDAPYRESEEEILSLIRDLQGEIKDLDEEISKQVDRLMKASRANPPEGLTALLEKLEAGSQVQEVVHRLIGMKENWDVLYTRICAFNEDDDELLDGLIPLVGEFLLEQPEGIGERWIRHLEEYLERQHSNVN